MKSIMFITPGLNGGGAEKNMVNTINSINLTIFKVILLITGSKNQAYLQLLPNEIEIKYLNKNSVSKAYLQIIRVLLKEKPDAVFTSLGNVSMPVLFIKKIFFQKYITIARVPSLPSNRLGSTIKSKLIHFPTVLAYRFSDYVIAQSAQMKKEVVSLWKVQSAKVIHIPNLINNNQILEFAKREHNLFDGDCFNIIAIGSLYSVKGYDLLIQAIALVKKHHSDIKLYIVGKESIEKGYKSILEAQVKSLNLEEQISFLGFKSNPYPYLKCADLFVLSSRKEGFPNVVLEALTVGTPVIATNCVDFDGVIIEGENGYIVQKNDVSALTEGIIKGRNLKRVNFKHKNFNFNKWFSEISKLESNLK